MKPLTLLPAVDVRAGQAVRLVKGELANEQKYGSPLETALEFQKSGAEWIHLVDLDAAFGTGSNYELISKVIETLEIKVQLSGGIRDQSSLELALDSGCARINLSTSALDDLDWTAKVISEFGDRIAVPDANKSTEDLFETLSLLDKEGCSRYVLTDVNTDGAMQGPNFSLLRDLCAATTAPVIASGGVSSIDDVVALRSLTDIGVEGAIIGKALYAQAFTFSEALGVASQ
jgi:1-(5-phosphoribosyl)-5-[(5-phosphoribosylamino)methylideneamino] imidazole-4-carboxamide isomerase/N-(5'phosphoribosyl)anthranilate isomerase